MMEKEENIQLDLFSQANVPHAQSSPERVRFFSYIRSYEKNILLIIGIVIMGIICFSIGVEKGKLASASKITSSLETISNTQPKAVITKNILPVVNHLDRNISGFSPAMATARDASTTLQAKQFQPLPIVSANPALAHNAKNPAESVSGYTIQLASYKSRSFAQKEAELLKKRGLLPLVIPKGNYTILCVGRFPTKEGAQSLLAQLTKRYQGCYLRRL